MSSPATYSFGADAVRYGSDLSGQNSAYFLQNNNGGGGAGVVQLVAGTNITLSPSSGEGVVTINASGGGAVSSVSGTGAGINVTPTTGAVVVSNTGVTSLAGSGAGIGVSASSGAVTLSNTGVTSIVAGNNVTVSAATGAVTVNASLSLNSGFPAINITAFTPGTFTSLNGSTTQATAVEIPIISAQEGLFTVLYAFSQSITTSNGFSRTNSAWFKIAKSGIYTTLPPIFMGGFADGNSADGSAVGWATVFSEPPLFTDPNFWFFSVSGKAMAPQPRESNGNSNVSVRLVRCAIG